MQNAIKTAFSSFRRQPPLVIPVKTEIQDDYELRNGLDPRVLRGDEPFCITLLN